MLVSRATRLGFVDSIIFPARCLTTYCAFLNSLYFDEASISINFFLAMKPWRNVTRKLEKEDEESSDVMTDKKTKKAAMSGLTKKTVAAPPGHVVVVDPNCWCVVGFCTKSELVF
jgi:hypothetical protein